MRASLPIYSLLMIESIVSSFLLGNINLVSSENGGYWPLMYKRHNKGPKVHPLETTLVTVLMLDKIQIKDHSIESFIV